MCKTPNKSGPVLLFSIMYSSHFNNKAPPFFAARCTKSSIFCSERSQRASETSSTPELGQNLLGIRGGVLSSPLVAFAKKCTPTLSKSGDYKVARFVLDAFLKVLRTACEEIQDLEISTKKKSSKHPLPSPRFWRRILRARSLRLRERVPEISPPPSLADTSKASGRASNILKAD